MNENEIKRIKESYPKGTRIVLNHMNDPYHPVSAGTKGTVDHVDDAGQLHMKWDNGRGLALVPEVDDFNIINEMKVIVVEPNQHPRVEIITNDLDSMQEIVEGSIEEIPLSENVVLVCNEEGKLLNLKANRSVGQDIIAGTFFIAVDDGDEELVSLTDEQIEKYTEKFYSIEEHTQEEIQRRIGFKIFGM